MTDESVKVQRYDTRQRGLELKKQLATIDSKLKQFADDWDDLGRALRDSRINNFHVTDDRIEVRRPDPTNRKQMNIIASVSRIHFDGDGLCKLLTELEATKREFEIIRRQCADMGDPL